MPRNLARDTQVAAICSLKELRAQKKSQDKKLAFNYKVATTCAKEFSP